MYLIFYKVINSLNYDRHTFDGVKGEQALTMLRNLPDDERCIYDTSTGESCAEMNVWDLVSDYNDECLDGGWWVTVIDRNDPEWIC